MYISAKYFDAENKEIQAVDAQGVEYIIPPNSQEGSWLRYITEGGTISPYVAPPPPDLDALDTYQINHLMLQEGSIFRALAEATFNLANEVRVLKSQAPLTKLQFKNYLKSLMR